MLYDKNDFRISEMGVSALQLLERRIAEDGVVLPGGILKVDGFLNHLMDPELFTAMAKELYRLYEGEGINKILTIEASGIGLACITGQVFGCPVLFAKKNRTRNLFGEFWTATVHSFTHGDTNTILVSKDYIGPEDRVLIVDDFLANGAALHGLISLVRHRRRSRYRHRKGLPAGRRAYQVRGRQGGVPCPDQVDVRRRADRVLLTLIIT